MRVLIAAMFISVLVLLAKADSTSIDDDRLYNRQGLGFSLETLINLEPYGESDGGKIYFPIRHWKGVFFEPFVGVYHLHRTEHDYNSEEQWLDLRSYSVGFGYFVVKRTRRVDWMLGFRAERVWNRQDSSNYYSDGKVKTHEMVLSPTVAAEYAFLGGFSIGAEASLDAGSLVQSQDYYTYASQRTETKIMLRYYIGQ